MQMEDYQKYLTAELLMGPGSARILEELLRKHPLKLTAEDTVLDLGCGKGLTSLVIAGETGAKVCAADLWIAAGDNQKRFAEWGVDRQVTAVHADASDLPFEKDTFQAMISVDAYHYFATGQDFFAQKILPFLKNAAEVLIGIPGIKAEYAGRSQELLSDWLGDEAYMFRSAPAWKDIIGTHDRIETVETWEMDCFDLAWNDWFATGHKYAMGDLQHFETLIKPYTCFVGIRIKLK